MKKILIAEDDLHILNGLSDLFESEGYDVFLAKNGTEALQLHAKESFSLILLDVMMPEKVATMSAAKSAKPILPRPSLCSPPKAKKSTKWWD